MPASSSWTRASSGTALPRPSVTGMVSGGVDSNPLQGVDASQPHVEAGRAELLDGLCVAPGDVALLGQCLRFSRSATAWATRTTGTSPTGRQRQLVRSLRTSTSVARDGR